MAHLSGTIDLEKLWVVSEAERERQSDCVGSLSAAARAIICRNEELVELKKLEGHMVWCKGA
jgi:hypothetical protein